MLLSPAWKVGLIQALADPAVAQRAFEAMMQMTKIDIATIESALRS